MNDVETTNIAVVRKYFDGCNTGNLDDLLITLAPNVRHYFLPPSFPPIAGAEHLARYWRKYKHAPDPLWSIDRIIASGLEVVNAEPATFPYAQRGYLPRSCQKSCSPSRALCPSRPRRSQRKTGHRRPRRQDTPA